MTKLKKSSVGRILLNHQPHVPAVKMVVEPVVATDFQVSQVNPPAQILPEVPDPPLHGALEVLSLGQLDHVLENLRVLGVEQIESLLDRVAHRRRSRGRVGARSPLDHLPERMLCLPTGGPLGDGLLLADGQKIA